MAIFGTSNSMLSGSIEVELINSVLEPDYIISEYIVHQSVLTGKKSYLLNKHNSKFNILVYLFKDGEPSDLLNKILMLKNEGFYFIPHVDSGNSIVDIYNTPVLFNMINATPFYINSDNRYDAITLQIVPKDYTYINLTGTPLSDGYGYDFGRFYGLTGW